MPCSCRQVLTFIKLMRVKVKYLVVIFSWLLLGIYSVLHFPMLRVHHLQEEQLGLGALHFGMWNITTPKGEGVGACEGGPCMSSALEPNSRIGVGLCYPPYTLGFWYPMSPALGSCKGHYCSAGRLQRTYGQWWRLEGVDWKERPPNLNQCFVVGFLC